MSVPTGHSDPVTLALLKMLGCPENVVRLKYVASVDAISVVTITYYPEIANGEELELITKKFKLEPL